MTQLSEFAINNGAIRDIGPLLPLTDNLTYVGGQVMANQAIPQIISQYKRKKMNLVGIRFGRLVVIREIDEQAHPCGKSSRQFECKCDCGKYTNVVMDNLRSGGTQSCGCLAAEKAGERWREHGLSSHPLYKIWLYMRKRCNNPKADVYEYYGENGITVCDEWENDPEAFVNWAIANGWRKDLVLDRENVSLGYSPDNCRFVTWSVSATNKRLIQSNNTSGYRGVYFNRPNSKWRAEIRNNNKTYYLGQFDSAIDAAVAYDNKVCELQSGHPTNFGNEV